MDRDDGIGGYTQDDYYMPADDVRKPSTAPSRAAAARATQVRGGASVAAGRHPLIQRILVGSVTATGRVTDDDDSWLEAQSSDSDFDEDSE